MLILTLIRHGESTDNVKSVWAGWKDAGLTNHGMNQAKALAQWFSEKGLKFDIIFSSTLQRADATAQAIYDQQADPKPPFLKNPTLREQNFGKGEGHPYTKSRGHADSMTIEECYAQNIFPHPGNRTDRFPEGESRNDLAKRATQAIEDIILPLLPDAAEKDVHVALVSHGLFIREMVDAILKLDTTRHGIGSDYRGLRNTGWMRVTLKDAGLPTLSVSLTDINRHDHLSSVARQQGGIGSMAYDSKQKDIRSFFGGGKAQN